MSEHALIVEVRLLSDRWHGSSGYPPSPFRLFQALIAGAYGGRWRTSETRIEADAALRWLENLAPPTVIAPRMRPLNTIASFVPNNDLDVKGNDPRRTAEIRAQKTLKSSLLESDDPFAYIWSFDGSANYAHRVVSLSERLHTFGRGVDAAYARASIVDGESAEAYETTRSALRSLPSIAGGGTAALYLDCPVAGSLDSLHRRYEASTNRMQPVGNAKGKVVGSVFRQPPKPELISVAYERPTRRILLDVRNPKTQMFHPVRIEQVARVATAVRDAAFERLAAVANEQLRERLVLGRQTTTADRRQRLRFIPLPSIGGRHTDASIRRIAVEIPPDCPLEFEDIRWALAGRPLFVDTGTGEVQAMLVLCADQRMLRHYMRASRRWQTVTPMVLPVGRSGRRLDGQQRSDFERSAASAVCDALRHARIDARPTDIRVQREPLFERGTSASMFDADRFEHARLMHVEIRFADVIDGPMVLGDGRWLGLGLMRPVRERDEGNLDAPSPASESIEALMDAFTDDEETEDGDE